MPLLDYYCPIRYRPTSSDKFLPLSSDVDEFRSILARDNEIVVITLSSPVTEPIVHDGDSEQHVHDDYKLYKYIVEFNS